MAGQIPTHCFLLLVGMVVDGPVLQCCWKLLHHSVEHNRAIHQASDTTWNGGGRACPVLGYNGNEQQLAQFRALWMQQVSAGVRVDV